MLLEPETFYCVVQLAGKNSVSICSVIWKTDKKGGNVTASTISTAV